MTSGNKWLVAILVITVLLLPVMALATGGTEQYRNCSTAAGAKVSVTGDESKGYAQVKLPASLFKSGGVAIVLPTNQGGK